ncbi:MAG: amino acid--tRNA ligase-related protein [Candidatus Micrarchaeota archaeon]
MTERTKALACLQDRFECICSKEMESIDRVNAALYEGALEYFLSNAFTWVETPTITRITGACENVDTLYALDHFGCEAFLAQTGQLYLEAKIPLHEKVWTVMTSSRAEPRTDDRHLNQFTLVEFERQGDFELMLHTIEGIVHAMVKSALKKARADLDALGCTERCESYLEPFQRITYTDAITLCGLPWGSDLKHEDEMRVIEEHGGKPVFITHFPQEIKFFNMRLNRDNPAVVNSADLIMPFSGESAGSAERENDYETLVKRLLESNMYAILSKRGVTIEEFQGYLNIVKSNPVLHCGAGIGFARISQSILGFSDIKKTTNYPLTSQSLY